MSGQHMDLVNQVDLIAAQGWGVLYVVQDFSGIVDSSPRGGIDFKQIYIAAFVNAGAGRARPTGLSAGRLFTIECFSQQSCQRGFSYTSGASKEKGMMHPVLLQCRGQGSDHVSLANNVGKPPRSPLSGERLVTHESLIEK
jgi:hypothetical protein